MDSEDKHQTGLKTNTCPLGEPVLEDAATAIAWLPPHLEVMSTPVASWVVGAGKEKSKCQVPVKVPRRLLPTDQRDTLVVPAGLQGKAGLPLCPRCEQLCILSETGYTPRALNLSLGLSEQHCAL